MPWDDGLDGTVGIQYQRSNALDRVRKPLSCFPVTSAPSSELARQVYTKQVSSVNLYAMRGNQILVFLSVLASKASAFVPHALPALKILRRGANFDRRMTMATDSTTEQSKRVAIIGGGPAGALMALYLSQGRGFDVDVFEAFDEGRIAGPTVRSWNIVLFERGCAALKAGGVDLNEDVST